MENITLTLAAFHGEQEVVYSARIESLESWYTLMDQAVFPALRAHHFVLADNEQLIGALEDATRTWPTEQDDLVDELEAELKSKDALIEKILMASFTYEWPDRGVTFSKYKNEVMDKACGE